MMEDLVMGAPEELIGGNADDHRAAGAERGTDLAQERSFIRHVLEDVEEQDQIEARRLEGEAGDVGAGDRPKAAPRAEGEGRLRPVDTRRKAVRDAPEVCEEPAGTAAHVEEA
jgi:hypothetical protein